MRRGGFRWRRRPASRRRRPPTDAHPWRPVARPRTRLPRRLCRRPRERASTVSDEAITRCVAARAYGPTPIERGWQKRPESPEGVLGRHHEDPRFEEEPIDKIAAMDAGVADRPCRYASEKAGQRSECSSVQVRRSSRGYADRERRKASRRRSVFVAHLALRRLGRFAGPCGCPLARAEKVIVRSARASQTAGRTAWGNRRRLEPRERVLDRALAGK
jgi:hypothetical protein